MRIAKNYKKSWGLNLRILLLFLLVIGLSSVKLGLAQESEQFDLIRMDSTLKHVSLWWRPQGGQIVPRSLAPFFEEQIPLLKSHWLLSDQSQGGKFPEQWTIILDSTWKQSEGFWSPSLKSPTAEPLPAILLNPASLFEDQSATSLLVHEMAHLVHHQYRPHEESWVREGVALLAEHVLNGFLNEQIKKSKNKIRSIKFRPVTFNSVYKDGFSTPETSLTQVANLKNLNPEAQSLRRAQYGHLLQYFHYLYRLCGGEEFFKELVRSPSQLRGIEFLDKLLKDLFEKNKNSTKKVHPVCASFKESFKAFEIARFKQDFSEASRFLYPTSWRAEVRMTPQELPPYAAMAYDLKESESCPSTDLEWGSSRCIRVRFE